MSHEPECLTNFPDPKTSSCLLFSSDAKARILKSIRRRMVAITGGRAAAPAPDSAPDKRASRKKFPAPQCE
nr:hypothetical protein [uncultured bacterium]